MPETSTASRSSSPPAGRLSSGGAKAHAGFVHTRCCGAAEHAYQLVTSHWSGLEKLGRDDDTMMWSRRSR